MLLEHWEGQAYIEYIQFYVWDKATNPDTGTFDYSQENCNRLISVNKYAIAIFPVRNEYVALRVEIYDTYPVLENIGQHWDHIVEATLHLPTGNLEVCQWNHEGLCDFRVAPGFYRLRLSAANLATAYPDENDRYLIQLWPIRSDEPLTVIKQYVPK
jgi:hypothetical protein